MELNSKKTQGTIEKVVLKGMTANPPVYVDETNIALNLPALFVGNKGSGKTVLIRNVMSVLAEDKRVARILVLQKGKLADDAMTDESLAGLPKVEAMELHKFAYEVNAMIEARELIKAVGGALKKIVAWKQAHKDWKTQLNRTASLVELGVTDKKVLALLDKHEEISAVDGQIRFLIEFLRLAVDRYGDPD
jgi:ABC-type dipeptide/oligopeptide/nickel transport system ATPase component